MHIVNMTKFVIGLVFLALAAGLFMHARGQRGFSQQKQAAALAVAAAGIFLAIGLGLVSF